MTRVLDQYEQQMHQTPARVVVHKTSRYWPGERDGLRDAIESRVHRYDLMALEPQSAVRLIPASKYPPGSPSATWTTSTPPGTSPRSGSSTACTCPPRSR
jgi:hypothetical protein